MLSELDNYNSCTVVEVLCEFLEVAFHNLLYARKLYPETIFECKRKYGTVVHHSIHPGVNDYILNCINAINFHLKRNQLSCVFFCVNFCEKVLEKYAFQIDISDTSFESDPFLVKFEKYLCDFCLGLHSSVNYLDELPDGCTFTIHLQVSEYSDLDLRQSSLFGEFSWVNSNVNDIAQSFAIIPLPNIKSDFINLITFIEKVR